MTRTEKRRILATVLAITVPPGTLIGGGIGWLIDGTAEAFVSGLATGFLVTLGIVSFDVSWVIGLIPRRWREAPFLVVLITRSLVWLGIIVVALSLPRLLMTDLTLEELLDQQFLISVVASFLAALVFNFVGQVNRLLGRRVLVRLIVGRYHRPRVEDRVFLLVDLRDSTRIAEQLGNMRYHTFVKRFIADVTGSMPRYLGEVHRYVGDEVILTWTADEGLQEARCVNAIFAIGDTLESARDEYEAEFGVVPSFWAGLHLGPVVAGEVGTIKHEIAFLGDTLNTASRIEEACKQFQRQVLASADVVSAVELPDGVDAESVGRVDLRGVEESLELFSLSRRS